MISCHCLLLNLTHWTFGETFYPACQLRDQHHKIFRSFMVLNCLDEFAGSRSWLLLCVSSPRFPSQASTSARWRTATTSVTLRTRLWWRRLSATKREHDGGAAPPTQPLAHPPTERHVSSHYPSHCSILLWFWSRPSCTLVMIFRFCPPPLFPLNLFLLSWLWYFDAIRNFWFSHRIFLVAKPSSW